MADIGRGEEFHLLIVYFLIRWELDKYTFLSTCEQSNTCNKIGNESYIFSIDDFYFKTK